MGLNFLFHIFFKKDRESLEEEKNCKTWHFKDSKMSEIEISLKFVILYFILNIWQSLKHCVCLSVSHYFLCLALKKIILKCDKSLLHIFLSLSFSKKGWVRVEAKEYFMKKKNFHFKTYDKHIFS
jgi:hypothetical protein